MSENAHEAATRLMAEHGIRNEDLTKVLDVWREEGCEHAKYEMTHAEFRREREPFTQEWKPTTGKDLMLGDRFLFHPRDDRSDYTGPNVVVDIHENLASKHNIRYFLDETHNQVFQLGDDDPIILLENEDE